MNRFHRSICACVIPMVALPLALAAQSGGRITALKPRQETYPSLSPDGSSLVYSSDAAGPLNLYRMDVRTRQVTRLTHDKSEDSAPAWSPDGESIVFQREASSGQRDIWEIDRDGSDARNLTNTPDASEQASPVLAGRRHDHLRQQS